MASKDKLSAYVLAGIAKNHLELFCETTTPSVITCLSSSLTSIVAGSQYSSLLVYKLREYAKKFELVQKYDMSNGELLTLSKGIACLACLRAAWQMKWTKLNLQ